MNKWPRVHSGQETPAYDLLEGETRNQPLSLGAAAPTRRNREITTLSQSLTPPSTAGATYRPTQETGSRPGFVCMARLSSSGPSSQHFSVRDGTGSPALLVMPFTRGLCPEGGDARGRTRRGCARNWHPGQPTQPSFSGWIALLEGGLLAKCPLSSQASS